MADWLWRGILEGLVALVIVAAAVAFWWQRNMAPTLDRVTGLAARVKKEAGFSGDIRNAATAGFEQRADRLQVSVNQTRSLMVETHDRSLKMEKNIEYLVMLSESQVEKVNHLASRVDQMEVDIQLLKDEIRSLKGIDNGADS